MPSALPTGDVQSLGMHKVGDVLSFNVPPGTVGFSIVSQAVSAPALYASDFPNLAAPSPLLTPAQATFFSDTVAPPLDSTTELLVSGLAWNFNAAQYSFLNAALNFPNSTPGLNLALDGGLPSGAWTFTVNDYAYECSMVPGCDGGSTTSTYDMSVVLSPGPLPFPGYLAVDVYLVTSGLDAGSAVTNPAVQRFVKAFASIYQGAGICLSSITFHDVPQWALDRYSSLSLDGVETNPCSDYHQLFTLAQPTRSVPLFFVDDFVNGTQADGYFIIGIDGALPAPPAFNGTVASGAVVMAADVGSTATCGAQFDVTCGPDRTADVSAHETGHFLGLFHPTEAFGAAFDPLIDTPACICALCETDPDALAACGSNPDGGEPTLVDQDVCSGLSQQCGGANYVMFWLLTPGWGGIISPEESAVIRANPLIAAP